MIRSRGARTGGSNAALGTNAGRLRKMDRINFVDLPVKICIQNEEKKRGHATNISHNQADNERQVIVDTYPCMIITVTVHGTLTQCLTIRRRSTRACTRPRQGYARTRFNMHVWKSAYLALLGSARFKPVSMSWLDHFALVKSLNTPCLVHTLSLCSFRSILHNNTTPTGCNYFSEHMLFSLVKRMISLIRLVEISLLLSFLQCNCNSNLAIITVSKIPQRILDWFRLYFDQSSESAWLQRFCTVLLIGLIAST